MLDYASLDWKKSNKKLADETNKSANHFATKRPVYAPDTISKKFAAKIDWNEVPNSWFAEKSLAEIGRLLNCSRENVRQRKNKLIERGVLKHT